ncbi:MAG TPA: phosphoenolpyruvate carboxykinase (ATP) [bacterium]|nr:phosphoenolpyruvate carboxykinase (ATP) [bacterium]
MYKEYLDRRLHEVSRVIPNLAIDTLRSLAKHEEKTSKHGQPVYHTRVRNRSAKQTYHVGDEVDLGVFQQETSLEDAKKLFDEVIEFCEDRELICIDRQMGKHAEINYMCRMYVTKPYARLAYMWAQSLFEPEEASAPDFISVYVPEWPEVRIVVEPVSGVTLILGTDYFGEAKKSFLRKAMYRFKQDHGGLGLHAGSKELIVKHPSGEMKRTGFIMFGLSGTGKTTLTMHDHGLQGEEGVVIKQDDVILMDDAGYCYGTERGFFIKTEGLDEGQKVLYDAAMHPDSIFENVWLHEDGSIDFIDAELTSNGRGMIARERVKHTDTDINLPKAHNIIFITRRDDIIPPVARLTAEQAAAYFMLGESIETSAGDPTKAGQSKREVGTNPFIIGLESDEGNRLLHILRKNPDMRCYVLNTGRVGKKEGAAGEKITVQLSTEVLKHIALDDITWEKDPDWGYEVATAIPGIDMEKYTPAQHYTKKEYAALVEKLRAERIAWLAKFDGLDPAIPAAIEK